MGTRWLVQIARCGKPLNQPHYRGQRLQPREVAPFLSGGYSAAVGFERRRRTAAPTTAPTAQMATAPGSGTMVYSIVRVGPRPSGSSRDAKRRAVNGVSSK